MNGWANKETWNVSMWINNDEKYYRTALDFVRSGCTSYAQFVLRNRKALGESTPDGVSWTSPNLSVSSLDWMLSELQ